MTRFSRGRPWWIASGLLVAGIGAIVAFQVYETYRPMHRGGDRARFLAREALGPPNTDALVGLDWTQVDLAPAGDVTGAGARHVRRTDRRRPTEEKILHGGASSVFVVRVVERMEPGTTYALSVLAAAESTGAPAARIYLAREPPTAGNPRPGVAAETPLGPWHDLRGLHHDFRWSEVRYTADSTDAGQPLFANLESAGGSPETAVSWDEAQLFAYPPVNSRRVRDARLAMIREGTREGVGGGIVLTVFLSPVIAQLVALVLLFRTRDRDALPDGPWIRILLVMGLALAPIQELLAWGLVTAEDWQGHRGPGYWRYVWTSTRATVWLPWGVAASLLVGAVAIVGPGWRRVRLVQAVLTARAAAAATFVLPALLQRNDEELFRLDLPFLFVLPAAAALNDLLFARRLGTRTRSPDPTGPIGPKLWWGAWLATLGAQLIRAFGAYSRLAPERPGDGCFVVTAAAQGHPQVVRSWVDARGGRVNAQLQTLRALEARLRVSSPRFHRSLRGLYDRVGPIAAARLSSPWRADLAYLALKPLEWLARGLVCRRPAPEPRDRAA